MINTDIANKVTTGSYWLPMVDKRMPQAILDAGEVEVYKTVKEIDPDSVVITVIYGEGETSEFDLFVFIEMFVPKCTLSRTTYDKPVIAVDWSSDKQDKAAYVVMCTSCGGIISEVSEDVPAIPHANIYECARCATVTSYQENSPILSAVKRAQIEARLAAMSITEPPPVESKTKPIGRFEAFLNKEPISCSKLLLIFGVWVFGVLLSDIFAVDIQSNVFYGVLFVASWLFVLLVVIIDVVRTKNKNKRWLDNEVK